MIDKIILNAWLCSKGSLERVQWDGMVRRLCDNCIAEWHRSVKPSDMMGCRTLWYLSGSCKHSYVVDCHVRLEQQKLAGCLRDTAD